MVIYRCCCYICSRPRRSAIVTAWVLSCACSLATRFFDVEVNRRLGNGQLIRDLLVKVPVANEPENVEFAHSEVVLAEMLGQTSGNFRWHVPQACMHRADHRQQVVFGHAFQEVSGGAGTHGSLNLTIAVRGCEHDYTSS